jgi:drug/metabolite transporter (DMT)-like permease
LRLSVQHGLRRVQPRQATGMAAATLLSACAAHCCSVITAGRLQRNQRVHRRMNAMSSFDFRKLNRTMLIYRVVQVLLACLLVYVAFIFQNNFALSGRPEKFMSSIIATIVIQLLMIYPIYRLAWRDAGVEIEGCAVGITAETLAALRKKRLLGDLWKFCAVVFFLIFVTMIPDSRKAPGATQVLAITLFSFLLMCLSYFQCFNFSAKKRMKQPS